MTPVNEEKWKDIEAKEWDDEITACDECIQKVDKIIEHFLKMKVNQY